MLSEEQTRLLEQAGYPVNKWGEVAVAGYLVDPDDEDGDAMVRGFATVAAILGISPPGYRLVPEEVAQKGLRHVQEARRQAISHRSKVYEFIPAGLPADSPLHRLYDEAKQAVTEIDALASSLSPKEEDKPHE